MNLKERSGRKEENQHAFLSPSKYAWVNSDPDDILDKYVNSFATAVGTGLHEYAAKLIGMGFWLRKHDINSAYIWLRCVNGIPDFAFDVKKVYPNLMHYVNDAIEFHMEPEKKLWYSDNCFGTADAVSFKNGLLRIHDLKTGDTPAHMEQLEIYSALYCLENDIPDPGHIGMELRIYQNDEVLTHTPEPDVIAEIMDKIVVLDRAIEKKKQEG